MKSLLNGANILDFSRLLPGPMCTHILADMGAEVLRVCDQSRSDEHQNILESINRNKKNIYLNLKDDEDKNKVFDLILKYDVIVESFRPGVMARLGLDYNNLIKVNPQIIYCSITGYGQTSSMKDHPGHDINYLGYTGVLDQTGFKDSAPSLSNFQIADIAGGSLMAAVKILAALFRRERTGRGIYIDVAMLKSVLELSPIAKATNALAQKQNHSISRGEDLLNGGSPCYNIYETADGRYMALGALELKFWTRFLELAKRPDLIDLHLATGEHAKFLKNELSTLFKSKTQLEWIDLVSYKDTCCTPILTLTEALNHFSHNF